MTTLVQYRSRARLAKRKAKAAAKMIHTLIKERRLYDDGRLIILDGHVGCTQSLIKLIGTMRTYEAYAIYSKVGNNLRMIKCKDERILPTVLERKGVKLFPASADIHTGEAKDYRFASKQDQFLFELKFGSKR